MVKVILIITIQIFISFQSHFSNATEIHLEHSIYPEGSSWGTEGELIKKLNISEDKLPSLYKINLTRPRPLYVSLKNFNFAKGRFVNDEALLLSKINICLDIPLPQIDHNFHNAFEHFLKKIAGHDKYERPLEFSFLSVSSKKLSKIINCDLFILQGNWQTFPYSILLPLKSKSIDFWDKMVFAIYYRQSKNQIPIVTLHPDIKISYQPPQNRYVQLIEDNLLVDGRVLIPHEIGHFLNFSHLGRIWSHYGFSELTVMGKTQSSRTNLATEMRFKEGVNLWQYWDIPRLNIYRKLVWKYLKKGSHKN